MKSLYKRQFALTAGMILRGSGGDIYEAEAAELSGTAAATVAETNPSYYMSSNGTSGSRGVDMPNGASVTYTVNVPFDGKYKLDFNYGNGQGTNRNDMITHNPVNVVQTFALDGGEAQSVIMESTLFQSMTEWAIISKAISSTYGILWYPDHFAKEGVGLIHGVMEKV